MAWEMIYGFGALALGLVIAGSAFWNKDQSQMTRGDAPHGFGKRSGADDDREREMQKTTARRPEGQRRAGR